MAIMPAVYALIVLLSLCTTCIGENNTAPIIGILTLPCNEDEQNCNMENVTYSATTYLPASYVKFIESGGGRVLPLLSDMDPQKMIEIVSQINGILLTGGDAPFSLADFYWEQILNILSFLRTFQQQHDKQSAIPVWGTCLGLEAMVCATAQQGIDIMNTNITANYVSLPLNFTSNAAHSKIFNSTMDAAYSKDVYDALEENAITFNEHFYGFTPDSFVTDAYLSGNFTVLSTSLDIYNVSFVSLIESREEVGLYWYGSQFHPEKPMFEFARNIPKTLDAIYSNQYFAEFFVNECRLRNNNTMQTTLYNEMNIYNFDPFYTAQQSDNEYQQMYIFNKSSVSV